MRFMDFVGKSVVDYFISLLMIRVVSQGISNPKWWNETSGFMVF